VTFDGTLLRPDGGRHVPFRLWMVAGSLGRPCLPSPPWMVELQGASWRCSALDDRLRHLDAEGWWAAVGEDDPTLLRGGRR